MFDPRVKPKNGANVDDLKIVWCAENVEIAIKAYAEGYPLVAKPFLTDNTGCRRPNLNYDWSEFELIESMKCQQDIVYFAETYCQLLHGDNQYRTVKLFPYQKKILKAFQEEKYLIILASRQMGKTTTTAICLLWLLIFGMNAKIALLGDKLETSAENLTKLKDIYYRLPFFLKPGVYSWTGKNISFDNGNSVLAGACNLASIVGKTITVLYFDELAIPPDNESRPVVEFAFPTISAMTNGKIVATSSPRGDNIFKELYLGAVNKTNPFHPVRIDWWERPERDEKWKQEQIGLLGSVAAFEQQYGNKFLSGGTNWLSSEAIEYMEQIQSKRIWQPLKEFVSSETFSKLEMVEDFIAKSQYVEKEQSIPIRKLVDCVFVNTNLINENNIKQLPLLFTIDTSEGKALDSTIVNGFLPVIQQSMLDNFKQELIDDDFTDSFGASLEDDELYDDLDLSVSKISEEFGLTMNAYLEQAFLLDSNTHSPAMVALFFQILLKEFFNEDKCKVLCERDGIGSVMYSYLITDIIENSGIDQALLASADDKHFGIFMRGVHKNRFIETAYRYLEAHRLVGSHEMSIYQLSKFGLVGKRYQGQGCHDDHAMTFVMAGAYMNTNEFSMWLQNEFLEEEAPTDEFESYDDVEF